MATSQTGVSHAPCLSSTRMRALPASALAISLLMVTACGVKQTGVEATRSRQNDTGQLIPPDTQAPSDTGNPSNTSNTSNTTDTTTPDTTPIPVQQGIINFGANQTCAEQHHQPMYDDSLVVNLDNTLQNVVVSVVVGLPEGTRYPVPSGPVSLDQADAAFQPHGLALLSAQLGIPIPEVGTTTFRPPYSPVTLGALPGHAVGGHLAPTRRTAMPDRHAAR